MKNELLTELDDLIVTLEQPLSPEEAANGWTTRSQAAILSLLQAVREGVLHDAALPELSIGCGLAHFGVEEGSMLEKACAVSNLLRDFRGKKGVV